MPACNVSATYFHASETRIFVLFLRHFCVRLSRFHSSLSKNIVNLLRTNAYTRTRHHYLTVLQSSIPKTYPTFFKTRGEYTDIITSLTVSDDLLEILPDSELDQFPLGDGNLAALEVTRHPRCSIDHLELSKTSNPNRLSIDEVLWTRIWSKGK